MAAAPETALAAGNEWEVKERQRRRQRDYDQRRRARRNEEARYRREEAWQAARCEEAARREEAARLHRIAAREAERRSAGLLDPGAGLAGLMAWAYMPVPLPDRVTDIVELFADDDGRLWRRLYRRQTLAPIDAETLPHG